jgi:hypothetical protein
MGPYDCRCIKSTGSASHTIGGGFEWKSSYSVEKLRPSIILDQGYPAIEITDTAGNRNPYQHTYKDTINTLDIDFSIQVISAVVASVQTALNP